MYLGESIRESLDDAFDTNGEKYAFDDDLYMLADDIREYLTCYYGIRKYAKICEATLMAASSEEQSEIDEIAKKYSKNEILDCIAKAAFLAGAVWAKTKSPGKYKTNRELDHCPFCGKNYE